MEPLHGADAGGDYLSEAVEEEGKKGDTDGGQGDAGDDAVLLLALLLNGFAQVVASRIRTMQGFHLVMNLVLFPLLFFSGAFFPLEDLPTWLKVLATANPLSYAVDLLRTAVYADGSGYFGLPLDVAVLATLAAAAFLWGIGRRPAYQQ